MNDEVTSVKAERNWTARQVRLRQISQARERSRQCQLSDYNADLATRERIKRDFYVATQLELEGGGGSI